MQPGAVDSRIQAEDGPGGKMSINILLAAEQPLDRLAIRLMLEAEAEFSVAGEANNGDEVLAMSLNLQPDVVILDLNSPGLAAGEIIRKLDESQFGTKIIVLAAEDDGSLEKLWMERKINGFILKDEVEDVLIKAVRSVMRGIPRFSRCDWPDMAGGENSVKALTPREREVLRLVAQGKSNREIGKELNIAERTVRSHMESILQKLRVANRVEAVMAAVKLGWI